MRPLKLFDRLPAIHKIEDGKLGGPLEAYLQPVEAALNAVKDSIDALYHDLFIETCAPWVIPYIGDLLGTSHLAGDTWTLRADVADTIFLRRAKGTLGAIERLAHDLTGWGAHSVELRENLAWAQSLNHQRPDRGGKPAYAQMPFGRHTVVRGGFATIRDPAVLSQLGTAYDTFARFPDVSKVKPYAIHCNLPNLAVFLWRLASYGIDVQRSLAAPLPPIVPINGVFAARLFVHPLKRPIRLFGRSAYDPDRRPVVLTPLDKQPAPIPRERLGPEPKDDPIGVADPSAYVDVTTYDPALPIEHGGKAIELHIPFGLPTDWTIRGANLCCWEQGLVPPLADKDIAIDPVIGRIVIGTAVQADAQTLVDELVLSYRYGAVGPVGAHPIARDPALPPADFIVGQPTSPTLEQALADLDTVTQTPLVIEIDDNQIHDLDVNNVISGGQLKVGRPLYLRGAKDRRPIVRLKQPLSFVTASLAHEAFATVRIDGIMFVAGFAAPDPLIARAAIYSLDIRDSTLDPGGELWLDGTPSGTREDSRTAMRLEASLGFDAADLKQFDHRPNLSLLRTISGPLFIAADAYKLSLASSIIDAASTTTPAIAGDGDPATTFAAETVIDGVTIFGTTRVQRITGRGGIFTNTLTVDDDQHGCLKLCWFSNHGDRLPQNADCLKAPDAPLVFTSEVFGHEAYAQIALDSDPRILNRGPSDDQMGAYGFLLEAHKWLNLSIRLREFTPVGVRPLLIPAT